MTRGSRKHVLDWTGSLRFPVELLALVKPVPCVLTAESIWQPMGKNAPREARLETFGPLAMPGHPAWPAISSWWLRHSAGANTPNWDIALSCDVDGQPGIILVEAKANVPEMSEAGKRVEDGASAKSKQNHEHIGRAIEEAREQLTPLLPGIAISHDKHYQLSNRIAFAWKLATLGIPTVLVYLGFTGDMEIADVGAPFDSDEHWQATFRSHFQAICPVSFLETRIAAQPAHFWMLSRSRPVE
jgi:hypothetical protein